MLPGPRKQRWTITVLGGLLVLEGLGKLIAPAGYFAALGRFAVLPARGTAIAGSVWMALELAAGLALTATGLLRRPSRALGLAAAIVAFVLQLAYAALSVSAFARQIPIGNCTCFGVFLAQRLSWLVLLQDAYMIVFSLWQVKKIA